MSGGSGPRGRSDAVNTKSAMRTGRLIYRPIGMVVGVVGGMAATKMFNKTWKLLTHQDDAPDAMDRDRGWGEILAAAAVQGAIYAVVHAAVNRGGAVAFRRGTGIWPGH